MGPPSPHAAPPLPPRRVPVRGWTRRAPAPRLSTGGRRRRGRGGVAVRGVRCGGCACASVRACMFAQLALCCVRGCACVVFVVVPVPTCENDLSLCGYHIFKILWHFFCIFACFWDSTLEPSGDFLECGVLCGASQHFGVCWEVARVFLERVVVLWNVLILPSVSGAPWSGSARFFGYLGCVCFCVCVCFMIGSVF